ncbi:MAG: DUF4440 domain-containing protein [Pseudomonadota bacterium]
MKPSSEEILKLERQVWEALRTGDAQLDGQMLSDDFFGVYPTRFADRSEHVS